MTVQTDRLDAAFEGRTLHSAHDGSPDNGRELFYVNGVDELWSVTVATQASFSVRERKEFLALLVGVRPLASSARFDVAPGDQRFLMIRTIAEAGRAGGREWCS